MSKKRPETGPTSLQERRKAFGGPRRHKDEPNARTVRAAIVGFDTAPKVTRAVAQLHETLESIGHSTGGAISERVTGGERNDRTEHHARIASETLDDLMRISDAVSAYGRAASALDAVIANVIHVAPMDLNGVMLCGDHQFGRQGATGTPDHWGDTGCTRRPVSKDLCEKHVQGERRWRKKHDLPSRDEAAA
jgi:hypothetical protein